MATATHKYDATRHCRICAKGITGYAPSNASQSDAVADALRKREIHEAEHRAKGESFADFKFARRRKLGRPQVNPQLDV
jgi:hypothetical protein